MRCKPKKIATLTTAKVTSLTGYALCATEVQSAKQETIHAGLDRAEALMRRLSLTYKKKKVTVLLTLLAVNAQRNIQYVASSGAVN